MAKGPALNLESITSRPLGVDMVGFRAIGFYDIGSDSLITRLDIKIGANQYVVGFQSAQPVPRAGPRRPDDDLATPNSGITECFNVKLAKADIIAALEELLADIRADVQSGAHKAA